MHRNSRLSAVTIDGSGFMDFNVCERRRPGAVNGFDFQDAWEASWLDIRAARLEPLTGSLYGDCCCNGHAE